MHTFLERHYYTGILVILACAIGIGAYVAHRGQERFVDALTGDIARSRAAMADLAVITDSNGTDEVIGGIIGDCARRDEFDAMLIALATLPKEGLLEVQGMFESCGDFYAHRKALMVARLAREYEEYERLLALHQRLLGVTPSDEQAVWKELVELEKTRSGLLTDQTAIQEDIITALIQGSSAGSTDVRALVTQAQEIGDMLSVYDKRIDALRASLNIS